MEGGKNWFFPIKINATKFFCDSHWLEIWSNQFCPSMGPNGGSVAMDSGPIVFLKTRIVRRFPAQTDAWFWRLPQG
jgi:hypothetical protein